MHRGNPAGFYWKPRCSRDVDFDTVKGLVTLALLVFTLKCWCSQMEVTNPAGDFLKFHGEGGCPHLRVRGKVTMTGSTVSTARCVALYL